MDWRLEYETGLSSLPDIDELNDKLMNAINASGEAYLSHTKLNGKFTLRLSVGSIRVQERHLKKVWDLLNERLRQVVNENAQTP